MMQPGLLEQVRRGCEYVANHARYIRICNDRIRPYAVTVASEIPKVSEHDPDTHYLGHGNDTAAFFLILDTINFGSGYFPHLRKLPGKSGYFTIASRLTEYFKSHGTPSAQELMQMSPTLCAAIFDQDLENSAVNELMTHFATALKELGRYLSEKFNGSVMNLIHAAESSAENLMRILIEMPYFRDIAEYDGISIPFFKRAQILAADLATAFGNQPPGYFSDLDLLTIFADNLVPHVLRVDGILSYEDALAARIDHGELIPACSEEEIEIRACALHAVEWIKHELKASGCPITSIKLDYLLWNRGQKPYYKSRPRHRTRTIFY